MSTGKRQARRWSVIVMLTALIVVVANMEPSFGAAAPNQTGNIALNGTPESVNLPSAGQTATFNFPGTIGQAVSAVLSGSTFPGCPALSLALIRPDATQLTAVTTCTADAFLDHAVLDQAGTWSFRLTPTGSGTGTATLQAYDSSDQAKDVNVNGAPVNVAIKWPGQNGSFTFAGTSGQEISSQVTVSTLTGCPAYQYTLVRPNGTTLAAAQPGCDASTFFDAQTLDATGTWAVHLDPVGTTTGTAKLSVYDATDQAKAITLNGNPVNVSTVKPGQNASLTFSGTSGQGVSAQITNATFTGCTAFTVYLVRPTGSQFGTVIDSCTDSAFLDTQTLDASGTWTIVVDPQGTTTG